MKYTSDLSVVCEKIWRDGFEKGVDGRDDLPDFRSFFPQEKLKDSPSLEGLSHLPFSASQCEARVEKHGFAIQCTRSPFGGGCLCKTHQNMFDKLPDGKDIPYGRYNKERPNNTLNNGDPIKWDGVERQKKKLSSSTSDGNDSPKNCLLYTSPSPRD